MALGICLQRKEMVERNLIKTTGLKKGEKMLEELALGQNLIPTSHPKIIECKENIETKNINKNLLKIEKSLEKKFISKSIFVNMK